MRHVSSARRSSHLKFRKSAHKSRQRRSLGCESLEQRHLLTTFTVNALGDVLDPGDGVTTLREAVNQANAAGGADEINFDPDVISGSFILLTEGEISITDSLSINGLGTSVMGVNAVLNDADPDNIAGDGSRVFNISDGNPATNIEVTISDMLVTGADSPSFGGAISTDETTTLDNVIVFENAATQGGGAIWASVADGAVLTIRNSTLRDNVSGMDGGAVLANVYGAALEIENTVISGNTAGGQGGGVYLYTDSTASGGPTVTIADSQISGNSANQGGGVAFYGRVGAIRVTNSTITGNTATLEGGGFYAYDSADTTLEILDSTISGNTAEQGKGGGAYVNSRSTLSIARSTVSDNSATDGGGLNVTLDEDGVVSIDSSTIAGNRADTGTGGGIHAVFTAGGTSQVNITSSTLSGNSAQVSGGLQAEGGDGELNVAHSTVTLNTSADGSAVVAILDASADIQHSIIAGNNDAGDEKDLSFSGAGTRTVGFSLIGNNEGTGLAEAAPDANGNLIGGPVGGIIDPLLGSLGPNGGTTDTHALLAGSPAIDAGDASIADAPAFDQRGTPFIRIFDGNGDGTSVIDMGAFERISSTLIVDIAEDESDGDYSPGDLSLREAVGLAADATSTSGIVTFDASLSGETLALTMGEIVITHAVHVQGLGADVLAVAADDPTPGNLVGDGSRIFNIDDGDNSRNLPVVIEGLTLTGGDVTGGGGAIRSFENLTVQSSVISGNHAATSVDDLAYEGDGGAIWARTETGEVRITDSTITNNIADDDGGGLNLLAGTGLIVVENSTISGNTADGLSANGPNLGGGIRGFAEQGGELAIVDSTISDNTGQTLGPGDPFGGSGIGFLAADNDGDGNGDGGFRLERSTVSGNSGALFGGGVYMDGVSTITDSSVTGNSATYGGGIYATGTSSSISRGTISGNDGNLGGGIFNNVGNVIAQTTIDGNTAVDGAGVLNLELLDVNSSTISNNAASSFGGGISNGLLTQTSAFVGTIQVRNSTISGNQANAFGGGIFTVGDPSVPSTLFFSTVTDNTSDADQDATGSGGGIYAVLGTLNINHSIVAANQDASEGAPDLQLDPDGVGGQFAIVNVFNTLIGDNLGNDLPESQTPDPDGNIIGGPDDGVIDPLLGPLEDNGGPTLTHALLEGSPAIDAGDDDVMFPPTFDQRGEPFDRISGDRIDMGAYETQEPALPGDFNDDGLYTCEDIDALVVHIVDGLNEAEFDLNDDGNVDLLDVDQWLAIAGAENLPSGAAYLQGDANLDGAVNSADLNVVGLAWLADVRGWCAGDFTADGRVEAGDLNKIGLNWQMDVSGEAVAAPTGRTPRAPLAAHMAAKTALSVAVDVGPGREASHHRLSAIGKAAADVGHPLPATLDSREAFEIAGRTRIARYQTAHARASSEGAAKASEYNETDIVDHLLANWDR